MVFKYRVHKSDGRTDKRKDKQTDGWKDGQTDGRPAFLCPTQTSFAEDNKDNMLFLCIMTTEVGYRQER